MSDFNTAHSSTVKRAWPIPLSTDFQRKKRERETGNKEDPPEERQTERLTNRK